MATLSLAQSVAIIDAAIGEGRRNKLAPLAVAVLDAGGHLIAFKREDGATFLKIDIACAKAWGALGMGYGTRELAERADKFPTFISTISTLSQGRIIPSPGGVLILDKDREVIGAIGISGDGGDNDEMCAITGVEAAGLVAVPGLLD